MNAVVVHYKELALKGRNRAWFVQMLIRNISESLKGLPAGPINSPGNAALQSVIHPILKMTDGRDALYFVHGLDGKIHVNHDYAAHLRDVGQPDPAAGLRPLFLR